MILLELEAVVSETIVSAVLSNQTVTAPITIDAVQSTLSTQELTHDIGFT